MNYRIRRQWALLLGIGLAAVALVGSAAVEAFLLTSGALAAIALAAGFGGQLLLDQREGLVRERRLVTTAADLRVATSELERLATIDALTGVRNRRVFFEALGTESRRSQRYGHDLSVVMIDLDDFKHVNDEGGHPFGDHVLTMTAQALVASTRESDLVARYGGEEFVVMLPETDEAGAAAVADKLLRAIADLDYRSSEYPPPGTPPHRTTISVGLACGPVAPEQDETELVRRADLALYAAKHAGKNRVHRWADGGTVPLG